jgi:DNA-binding LacI/PurR family transcriptional regulator
LKIPGDLSILCLDNVDTNRQEDRFTHVLFDEHALGVKALDLLLDSTPGEEPRRVLVPVSWVDDGTTAPLSRQP